MEDEGRDTPPGQWSGSKDFDMKDCRFSHRQAYDQDLEAVRTISLEMQCSKMGWTT
jgi:hypothetical protein